MDNCYVEMMFLSSTWREIDSDTSYVVCISASLDFPYTVSISLVFSYMSILQTFKRNANVLYTALLWAATDAALSGEPLVWRHIDMAVIVARNTGGQREFRVITGCRSIKYTFVRFQIDSVHISLK